MPELPEVQTTAHGLNTHIVGLTITEVWTDYGSSFHKGKDSIKNPEYFKLFKREVKGAKIVKVHRSAKNILLELARSGSAAGTILIHMKMTGHVLYGCFAYDPKKKRDPWTPLDEGPLQDPFNRFIHFVMTLSNGRHVALSDMRKFAKVTFIPEHMRDTTAHLEGIGPEPLEKIFTFEVFQARLLGKSSGKIKPTLMDQSVIAGIGNIYADESLWRAGINPKQPVKSLMAPRNLPRLKKLYRAIRTTLAEGIDFGGDSMSDYRNIHGERGKFQETHRAYRKTGTKCSKPHCSGVITRIVLAGRGTHFCPVHQPLR